MNNVTIIVNAMFTTFLIGAMFRILNYIDLSKKHGIKNVIVTLGKGRFEKADTLMEMALNVMIIFLWCYVHFWMK